MMEKWKSPLDTDLILESEEFHYFRDKIAELAGISLSDVKLDLVRTRLKNRVLKQGHGNFSAYIHFLNSIPVDHPEWEEFINLLTTNKTEWFRENAHFLFLEKEFLPKWKKTGKKKLS